MTEEQLSHELKRNIIRRVYYLYGKEPFLVQTYADRIVKKCLDAEARDFNLIKFIGNPDLPQISESVETLPVFADKKVILLNDFDAEKCDTAELEGIFSRVPESTVIIISVTGFAPDQKKAKTKKLAELAARYGACVEFVKMNEAKAAELIIKRAGRFGCTIARWNAIYLAANCLCDINLLAAETDKLCAYNGYKGEITRETIDLLTEKQLDAGIFTLASEITAKKSASAMRILNELIELGNPPVMIMSALSTAFIDFYRAKTGAEYGKRPENIAADFNYPKNRVWAVGKAVSAVAGIPKQKLLLAVKALADADYRIKSTPLDARYVMERAVAELIAQC